MKALKVILILIVGFSILLPIGSGLKTSEANRVLLVEIRPGELRQGRTALLRVASTADVTRMEAVFDGRQFPLYRSIDGDWIGFLASDMYSERGTFPIAIVTWSGETANPPESTSVEVGWGGFLFQNIHVSNVLLPLLDPELNDAENQTLGRVYNRYSNDKLWTGSLQQPVPGVQISEFGGIRDYNDGLLQGRHTGVDFRAGLGEPIAAAGHGRVVYARQLPIHGNHVVIDHGMGVLTGYSHLQEMFVVPGQRVLVGDVIGLVGATGRVEGAHFHFELTVNGLFVDPTQFMGLSIPEAVEGN